LGSPIQGEGGIEFIVERRRHGLGGAGVQRAAGSKRDGAILTNLAEAKFAEGDSAGFR
jgi:hypothetical protein